MANTGNNNPGNFANDREKASEAGKKGGHNSGGNFANDREKASEAGRKGGSNSHGVSFKQERLKRSLVINVKETL